MARRDSLENYALFYEKIDPKNTADDPVQHMQNKTNYEKTRGLAKDDLSKLREDLRSPMQQSSQTNPLR